MRRLLAAAAIGAVLLTSAGCANNGTTGATGTTAAPTSAAPAGNGDTKAICDSLEASGKQFETDMTALGGGLTGGDPAKALEALKKVGGAFTTFTAEIRAKAATATDPEFKTALENAATAFETLGQALAGFATAKPEDLQKDPTAIMGPLSDPKFTKAMDDMDKFCPGLGTS
jgi:hypothetical protein